MSEPKTTLSFTERDLEVLLIFVGNTLEDWPDQDDEEVAVQIMIRIREALRRVRAKAAS